MPQLITLYLEEWLVYVVPTYKLKEKIFQRIMKLLVQKQCFFLKKLDIIQITELLWLELLVITSDW